METAYQRFAKIKVGWKQGNSKQMEISHLINGVEEASNIFDMASFRLKLDASDANWIDTPISQEEIVNVDINYQLDD